MPNETKETTAKSADSTQDTKEEKPKAAVEQAPIKDARGPCPEGQTFDSKTNTCK